MVALTGGLDKDNLMGLTVVLLLLRENFILDGADTFTSSDFLFSGFRLVGFSSSAKKNRRITADHYFNETYTIKVASNQERWTVKLLASLWCLLQIWQRYPEQM